MQFSTAFALQYRGWADDIDIENIVAEPINVETVAEMIDRTIEAANAETEPLTIYYTDVFDEIISDETVFDKIFQRPLPKVETRQLYYSEYCLESQNYHLSHNVQEGDWLWNDALSSDAYVMLVDLTN
jgi:hypothetical protein